MWVVRETLKFVHEVLRIVYKVFSIVREVSRYVRAVFRIVYKIMKSFRAAARIYNCQTLLAQVRPPPKAMSMTLSPRSIFPARQSSSKHKPTEPADVLP